MFKEFRQFIMRGTVVDLAVGVVIGAAFGAVVSSLVTHILMPLLGLLTRGIDFNMLSLNVDGVQLHYGFFLNAVVSFLLVSAAIFFFVVKPINRFAGTKKESPVAAPATRECPFCATDIPVRATRCPHCTSTLGETAGPT
jgi:large conductance mechanosensitive channel